MFESRIYRLSFGLACQLVAIICAIPMALVSSIPCNRIYADDFAKPIQIRMLASENNATLDDKHVEATVCAVSPLRLSDQVREVDKPLVANVARQQQSTPTAAESSVVASASEVLLAPIEDSVVAKGPPATNASKSVTDTSWSPELMIKVSNPKGTGLEDHLAPSFELISSNRIPSPQGTANVFDTASNLIETDLVRFPTASIPSQHVAPENLAGENALIESSPSSVHLIDDPVLVEMIQRVYAQNPSVREAQARISQARATLHRATAELFPQVSASGQYGYRRFSQNGNAFVQDSATTQGFDWYSTGFDSRWEIDFFGRLRGLRSAAQFEAMAAEQDYRDVMVTLVGDLMLAYVEYSMATERIRIANRNLQVQEEILEIARERLRIGEDGELAVAQALTQVELTRTTLPSLEEQRSVAAHRLLLLQGFGSRAIEIPEHWGQQLPRLPSAVPDSIDCELLCCRPDVRSSRLMVSAQLERLGASKTEYYPKVQLNGSISLETRDLSAWWDERSVAHSVGPTISLNLLDFGRIRATIAGERSRYEQAVAKYEQTVLDATEEVRNALVGVQRQCQRADALVTASHSANSVVEMAAVEYQAGLINFQSVLDAERQVLSIEDQRAVAYGTALISYARLYKALGGVWPENQPITIYD